MTLDFQLFGPLSVRRAGQPIPLGGDLPKAIIGRLALDAGEQVDTELLLTDVWAEPRRRQPVEPARLPVPAPGRGPRGLISGSRSGYALEVPPEAVDLLRFRAGAAELSRLGTGDDALAAARELVRVSAREPFEGLRAPFVAAARFRYREERRGVLERLGELLLHRGDITAAVLALGDAVDEHPYDEKPTRLLALALARSGRRSDALEAIDAFGRRLAEWRGLETPTRLRELRQAIVRHDPEVHGRATRTVTRTGVPHPLTRFVGRRDELERVAEAREAGRLVTLVGPGGVGKTRLAIELARAASQDDEQWFVDLSSVSDPDRVLAAVAGILGAAEPTLEAIAARLAERPTLVILDNAEHVIGAAAAVASGLLARSESVALLVTSREPLRLPGERVVLVTPLTAEDARTVFLERAADATGGRVDDALELVDAICESLDAIPLALELTAARLDVLSGQELLDAVRAGSGFDERGAGAGRHDSVASAVRWSVDLLTGSSGTFWSSSDASPAASRRRRCSASATATTTRPRSSPDSSTSRSSRSATATRGSAATGCSTRCAATWRPSTSPTRSGGRRTGCGLPGSPSGSARRPAPPTRGSPTPCSTCCAPTCGSRSTTRSPSATGRARSGSRAARRTTGSAAGSWSRA